MGIQLVVSLKLDKDMETKFTLEKYLFYKLVFDMPINQYLHLNVLDYRHSKLRKTVVAKEKKLCILAGNTLIF